MKKTVLLLLIISLAFSGCVQEKNPHEESLDSAENRGNTPEDDFMHFETFLDSMLSQGHGVGYDIYDPAVEKLKEFENSPISREALERIREKVARLKPADQPSGATTEAQENAPQPAPDSATIDEARQPQQPFKRGLLSPRGCNGTGSFLLGASPLALEDIEKIRPMGGLSSVHITPTDHQYWDTIGNNLVDDRENLDRFKVYAPGNGNIVEIGFMDKDYRVTIEHTCNFYTIFIHVDKLTDDIMTAAGLERKPGEQVWPRIPLKEGQVIGSIGTGKLDFSVVDEAVVLKGFANPESYDGEVWKIHTVDTFDYYKEPLRSQLLAKNVRTAIPLGGKIDYDVDGKLVGNWFRENTAGYRGLGNENYWLSHLTVVYDSIDPTQIRIGIGDFGDPLKIYGVTGNSPDPANVGIETGMVKYELVTFDYAEASGEKWDKIKFAKDVKGKNNNDLRGVVLLQVLPEGKLKAETFLNKKAGEVTGFTANAMVYER